MVSNVLLRKPVQEDSSVKQQMKIPEVLVRTVGMILAMKEKYPLPAGISKEPGMRRVLESGANGYVLKSDFPRSLVKAVKNVSQDKRFFSPKVADIILNGFLESPEAPNGIQSSGPSLRKPTEREVQIIRLLVAGKANKEIAAELGMAVRTVETHRAKIMLKLGLNSLPQLVQYAVRNGLAS